MPASITNINEINHIAEKEGTKVLSYSEELKKINKLKYNLSLVYFAGLAVLLSTLLW
jgi:hypothetical protein